MSARTSLDPLTDLVGSTPLAVQRWMEHKTLLADGHVPGLPVCSPLSLARALDRDEAQHGPWQIDRDEEPVPARPRAFIGFSHDLAGLSWRELSEREGESLARCRRFGREHRALVRKDADYRTRAARVLRSALGVALG